VEAFIAGAQHALLSHDQRHLEAARVQTEQMPSLTSAADSRILKQRFKQ